MALGVYAMISFKTVIITATAMIAVTSAWSTQLPQFFHAFSPPSQTPPLLFRSAFQDLSLQPRFYVHHQPALQYHRPPVQFYQPPPPPPPLLPPAVTVTRLLQTPHRPAADVHHHHVFYYYYLPADGETQSDGRRGGHGDGQTAARQPCDNRPHVDTTPCPPAAAYLPPASPPGPSPSPPPPTTPPTTLPPLPPPPPVSRPPPAQNPCDDDTVVVDNVEYYPFGGRRAPIVVSAAAVPPREAVREYDSNSPRSEDGTSTAGNRRPEIKPNFILANYLLPPDK